MSGCFIAMIGNHYRPFVHKCSCFLQVYHGTFAEGQGIFERICWCFGIYMDISVKSSTIILTAFMISESYNFKSLLGNITAVWFLDQLDEMTANFVLAQMDVNSAEIKSSDNFMKIKVTN